MTTTNLITELGNFRIEEIHAGLPALYYITVDKAPELCAWMRRIDGRWQFMIEDVPEPFRSAEKMLAGLIAVEREGLN